MENQKPTNPKDIIGSDKLPFHLCPTTFVAGISMSMLEGCLKYGRSNFRAVGVKASIYYDACLRHLIAWFEGEDIDPESGIHHLYKAGACLAVIADAMETGKLNDDRMVRGGYKKVIEKYTPIIKELKERHKDKNPKHYTIADNEVLEEVGKSIPSDEDRKIVYMFETAYTYGFGLPTNDDMTLNLPVYLINESGENKAIFDLDFKIRLTKVAKDGVNITTVIQEHINKLVNQE